MPKPGINEFYDINNFPKESGITYLGISIALINTLQNHKNCYRDSKDIISKISVSNVGAIVAYTDNLYLYSPKEAIELKLKHQILIEEHKQGWLHLIKKNINIIPNAYTFLTWSQLILDCPQFTRYKDKLYKIYESNKDFKRYILMDVEGAGREKNKYNIGFVLEEILLDYLITKGKVRLQNEYTKDREQWILNCYHGKPLRSHVYLHQKNFFNLENKKNIYENSFYDVLNKKLYDFDRLDIDTFDFSK